MARSLTLYKFSMKFQPNLVPFGRYFLVSAVAPKRPICN
jgi:hypothetical protein